LNGKDAKPDTSLQAPNQQLSQAASASLRRMAFGVSDIHQIACENYQQHSGDVKSSHAQDSSFPARDLSESKQLREIKGAVGEDFLTKFAQAVAEK
jgi:hypothetical protein